MGSLKHKWKLRIQDIRLRTKFLISFVFVALLSLTMSSILNYYTTTNSIKQITSTRSALLLDQIAYNFEQKVQDIEDLSFQEYKNAGFCRATVGSAAASESLLDRFIAVQLTNQFLHRMVYAHEHIPFAMVIGADGASYTQLRQDSATNQGWKEYSLGEDAREELTRKRGQPVWSPGDSKVIFMERAMYDVDTSVYCGVLVLGIETGHFKSIYPQTEEAGEIMFANPHGELLIYNDDFSAELYRNIAVSETNEFTHDDNRYIYAEKVSDDRRWRLLNLHSFDQFTAPLKTIRYWILITSAVTFAAAFLNAAILSNSITKRLNVLVSSMKTLSVGQLDTFIQSDAKDEIGLIASKFNGMAAKIRELIQRVGEERLQKEQAEYRQLEFEYKALQAQMNPHFLYNTLESIHALAKMRGQKEIGRMIVLLGRLLRESISRKNDVIPLRDEMNFVQDYLTLQSLTYESRLQVEYDIEERALDWTVPCFILQPIVENAIVHGIEEKPGVGMILIRCYEADGDIILEVRDNGVGMSGEAAAALLADEDEDEGRPPDAGHTRVGLRSVRKRLLISYGSEFGMAIRSVPNEGTTIEIRLPKRRKEEGALDNEGGSH